MKQTTGWHAKARASYKKKKKSGYPKQQQPIPCPKCYAPLVEAEKGVFVCSGSYEQHIVRT